MTWYTPGPWKSDGLRVSAEDRGTIAQVLTPQQGGTFDAAANARLIAAAPNLYTALEALESACRNVRNTEAQLDSLALARAALARARGEA